MTDTNQTAQDDKSATPVSVTENVSEKTAVSTDSSESKAEEKKTV